MICESRDVGFSLNVVKTDEGLQIVAQALDFVRNHTASAIRVVSGALGIFKRYHHFYCYFKEPKGIFNITVETQKDGQILFKIILLVL